MMLAPESRRSAVPRLSRRGRSGLRANAKLERKEAKLNLVVRSEKVARLVEFEAPIVSVYGKVGVTKRWARVYDYVLDERQARALGVAREMAGSSGLSLEVTDLTQEGALRRLLRLVSGRASVVLPKPSPSGPRSAERIDEELVVSSPASRP